MKRVRTRRNAPAAAPRGKKAYPLAKVYGLLEPGPVVMLSTVRDGRPNVMVLSWLTMMEFEPPLVGCVVSNANYSFEALAATKECVINIPTVELAGKVVRCGNSSGRKVDKFAKFGLTPEYGTHVGAPLVAECYANLECKVVDDRLVDKYSFFVLEVVAAWMDRARKDPRTFHHRGRGVFVVDGRVLKLPSRMK
ncbi:MAG TPA: flavin reductase family protein [Usitatibacter sp.]|nr:flavin reductase family protein [Usitatibacter sp.]